MSWTNIEEDLKRDFHEAITDAEAAVAKVRAHFHNIFGVVETQAKTDVADVVTDVKHVEGEVVPDAERLTQLAEQAVEHPAMAGEDAEEAIHDVQQWVPGLEKEVVTDAKTEVDKVETQVAEDVHPSTV